MADALTFEQVVKAHQQMVFRTLVRLTGSTDGVEDLAQEVFLRLFRALPGFRNESLVTTYLYRVAINVVRDDWKRQQRVDRKSTSLSDETSGWQDRLQHPSPNAEELLQEREFQSAVEIQLGRLSEVERAVLVLYHQEEQTYQQIAESLRLPIGTVRTHLHRARNKLRAGIAASYGEQRCPGTPAKGGSKDAYARVAHR